MPSADSCGDPFHEKLLDGNLPLGCGAEAIFNFSVDKEITPFGSGDTDHVDYHWPDTTAQTILSTRKVLSTPSHHRTTLSASTNGTGIVSVAPNKSATRLPPRFTPDPDSRRSSFQHLLRLHLNTFNQRLSMLESNTLDMRESIHRMEDQQINLSSQLKELIAVESAAEKTKRVTELEKSYNDMEARLSRLEGRLEILIDGFTALAQEMNKMKRTRHTSRSLQERMPLPSLSTVLVPPRYSTTHPPGKRITTKRPLTHRATVLQSIPTPSLLDSKPTTIPGKERKMLTVSAESLENTTTRVTSPSKHKVSNSKPKLKENVRNAAQPQSTTKPLATAKPEAKGRVSKSPIGSAKHVSQSNQTRLNQVQDKVAVTKFQLEPPSHRVTAQRHSAKSGRDKAFRSDEPLEKTVQRGRNVQNTNSVKVVTANIRLNTTKTTVPSLRARKKNLNTPATATSTPASSTATNANNSKKMKKQTRAPGTTKARTSKKSSTTTKSALHHKQTKSTTAVKSVKKPSSKAKTKARVATKKQQQNDKKHTRSGILDLLKLLKGGHKKHADGSLHVVLGRLAIPIRIIPDD